ncbi:hypothetical protein ALC53_07049 [Atta colombica]|uniref:Uncharacterized protein n=1 Tax=Atta colombica TaxID=520822 RepID=A0A195BDC1_9HYME|nr:hypothetical protein ALC53_07049 [Atta colombica]
MVRHVPRRKFDVVRQTASAETESRFPFTTITRIRRREQAPVCKDARNATASEIHAERGSGMHMLLELNTCHR